MSNSPLKQNHPPKTKSWEKLLEEKIHKHLCGLLETNFGEDVKKMAFLQIDCLARDILPLLSKVRTQAIEEERERIRKHIDNDLIVYGVWHEVDSDLEDFSRHFVPLKGGWISYDDLLTHLNNK